MTGLVVLLLANALGWAGIGLYNLIHVRRRPQLELCAQPAVPPTVSILVPARNEAGRILAPCLRSLLAQDYPYFEVIAIDDRSTDATAAILADFAARDNRLRVVAGSDPPPGWIGKTHALHCGLATAQGDWIVGTDADMLWAPDLLRHAVAAAEAGPVDLLTLLPRDSAAASGARFVMPIAAWMILTIHPPLATNNPRDPRALGCGGFLMLRREALDAVGGYAAIAGDVADDVALAERVKQTGRRLFCGFAPDRLATPMYGSTAELWAGFRKNALRGVRHSLPRALGSLLALGVGSLLPVVLAVGWAVLALLGQVACHPLGTLAAVATVSQMLAFGPVHREYGNRWWAALTVPFGFAVMAGVLAAAAWRAARGQTVSWRGREVAARRSPPPRGEGPR
ncbi:MAG: glycosyltransferase [Fimbriimonadaceae bacterium]|nr:glycosyltransferase [Fimbriimonadaceae bacterium]